MPHGQGARTHLAQKALESGDGSVPGETKREALIRLYEERGNSGDAHHGNAAKAAQLARELAAEIGYPAGTARRELAKYLASGHGHDGGAVS